MTAFRVVTTCNRDGWEKTGRRMAASFKAMWPDTVPLIVYAEGFIPDVSGLHVRRLPPWHEQFKAQHINSPVATGRGAGAYDFKTDCVRFSHKVAAVIDAGLAVRDGVLIWIDADTFTHAPVTETWLEGLFPGSSYIAWLDRLNNYPECGFVMYRCHHRSHKRIMNTWRDLYVGGEVFELLQTHDCFSLQYVIETAVLNGAIERPVSLSGAHRGWHHPFVAGPLGACLDHMKGGRKDEGKSRRRDHKGRSEDYWKDAQ